MAKKSTVKTKPKEVATKTTRKYGCGGKVKK